MKDELNIRRADVTDAADLLTLVEQYWRFEGIAGFDVSRILPQLRRVLAEPRLGCCWIASLSGVPAGYLIGVYVFSLEHFGLTAEIDEFFVRPEFRARGIGAQLLRAAEATFAEQKCTNVSLQLARANAAAREFYRRRGYGERSGYELLDKDLRHKQRT
jgi:ribosomal protein S18 acetylase RimI-like enzyme